MSYGERRSEHFQEYQTKPSRVNEIGSADAVGVAARSDGRSTMRMASRMACIVDGTIGTGGRDS
jgi:hypothetical protein